MNSFELWLLMIAVVMMCILLELAGIPFIPILNPDVY